MTTKPESDSKQEVKEVVKKEGVNAKVSSCPQLMLDCFIFLPRLIKRHVLICVVPQVEGTMKMSEQNVGVNR